MHHGQGRVEKPVTPERNRALEEKTVINGGKRREEIKRRASRGRLSNEKKGEGALNRANLTYEYCGSRERVSIDAFESLPLIEQF